RATDFGGTLAAAGQEHLSKSRIMNARDWKTNPPPLVARSVAVMALAAFAFLRLYVYGDQLVPLTDGLVLLLSLWHRNRPLHFAMAACLTSTVLVKTLLMLDPVAGGMSITIIMGMLLVNIWTVTLVVDGLLVARSALLASNEQLVAAN